MEELALPAWEDDTDRLLATTPTKTTRVGGVSDRWHTSQYIRYTARYVGSNYSKAHTYVKYTQP